MRQGVIQALVPHLATEADLLGLPGGAALLGEEGFGIRLRAQGAVLPLVSGRQLIESGSNGIGADSNSTGASGTKLRRGRTTATEGTTAEPEVVCGVLLAKPPQRCSYDMLRPPPHLD